MAEVVQLKTSLVSVPMGPRESTPEIRASLRRASVKAVREKVADISRVSVKTWTYVGKELIGIKEIADKDGKKVFASLFGKGRHQFKDEAKYPFSKSTGYMLMDIAKSELSNILESPDSLPAQWATLHELTRIPSVSLLKFIESGAVHPMMTRAEAKKLAGAKQRPKRTTTDYAVAKRHFMKIEDRSARVEAFAILMRDCGITVKEIEEIKP